MIVLSIPRRLRGPTRAESIRNPNNEFVNRTFDTSGVRVPTRLTDFNYIRRSLARAHALYTLELDGGTVLLIADQRVRLVLDEHAAAGHRRQSAQVSTGDGAASSSADSGSGSGGGVSGGSTAKAPAFSRINHELLEAFVRRHRVNFMAKMNTPESDAWRARSSLGPLGDKAPHRILRAALHRDWGVSFLQFIPAKLNSAQ